jgi:TolB-like protein/tetratricopeptide (TPR) repeat protein
MTDALLEQLQAALGPENVIKRELGGGGMSRVFLVEEHSLHRLTVLKVLPPELAAELSVARFDREIRLLARLQHPHIVPLIAAGNAAGVPYYRMPFVDGETLHQRLQRTGELTIAEAVRLLREIASALAYAHEHGVVHRDIKPDNILITGGVALVADFGVAKALIESTTMGQRPFTAAGMSVGTPAYMSPEQVSADPDIDQRADLYSFGAVAYEMLTGRAPFTARTTQALLAAHVVETPEPIGKRRPSIPADLATLVMRCLEKRPSDRPQSANDVIRALDAIQLSSGSTIANRKSGDFNTLSSSRKRRAGFWIVGALGAAVAVGASWHMRGKPAARVTTASNRVLIAPFLNPGNEAKLEHIGALAADRLASATAQAGFDVVPAATVALALRDTSAGRSEQLKRLARATHAKWMVTGSVYLRGDSLQVQAQIVSAASDSVEEVLEEKRGAVADPVAVVDLIGAQLQSALSRRTKAPILPSGFRAPDPEAYKELLAGFQIFAIGGDIYASRPHLRRAIELDSTMVQAYELLGRQYINAGEYATADSVLKRIETLKLPMTETEQYQLKYGHADLAGNIEGMAKNSQALVALDSNALSLFLLGEADFFLLRTDDAIQAMRAAEPTFEVMGGRALLGLELTLANVLHVAGRSREALQTLKAHDKTFRRDADLRGGMLREAIALRDTVMALALVDSMLNENLNTEPAAAVSWLITGIEEFRVHGDNMRSQRICQLLLQRLRRSQAALKYPAALLDHGTIFMLAGMPDSALARFGAARARSHELKPTGYLAVVHAQLGDTAGARSTADSLGKLQEPWMLGTNTYWQAIILATLGDRQTAVELLRQSVSEGCTMDKWHSAPELNALRGYAAFDQLLTLRN